MSEPLKVHYRVGDIEFDAEGSAEDVEKQRKAFMSELLPEAVNAVIQTRRNQGNSLIRTNNIELLDSPHPDAELLPIAPQTATEPDWDSESLASYANKLGKLNDQDFVIVAAYYDEQKNGNQLFSNDSVRSYYQEARRNEYSNIGMLFPPLVKKGFIMEVKKQDGNSQRLYKLTATGISRILKKEFTSEKSQEKKLPSKKSKKPTKKTLSAYSNISIDDLNIKNYPEVKSLATFKDQMLLVMYIVSSEGKGEYFGIRDISYLITDLWGIHSSEKAISKVFTGNKTWFKTETFQSGGLKRKLLEGGKDYAKKLIASSTQP